MSNYRCNKYTHGFNEYNVQRSQFLMPPHNLMMYNSCQREVKAKWFQVLLN